MKSNKYRDKHQINVYLNKEILNQVKSYQRETNITFIRLYNDIIKLGWEAYKKDSYAPKK